MARGGRKCKRTANGLRDEPIEQPPSCHETRQQPPLGTSHENVIEQVQGEAARAPQSPIQNSTLGIMHESGDQVTQQADGGKETTNDSSEVHQKTRGPTFMKEIWGRPKDFPRIEIKLDDNGIPISEKTSFSEFLGSLARNGMYCPIDVESWLKMPRKLKMDMLEVIKERFALPMGLEAWTLRSIGKKWRSWKADLKATYFDPAVPNAEARFQKDIRVREEQWIKLWVYWKSEEAKVKQLGRPPTRVEMFNKFYTHADGTPSSIIVAENLKKMNELKNQLPSESQDPVGRNDIFAQVVGQDKHGHVRLFSDGVNPTDLWEDIPSHNTCYRISVQQQSTLVRLEERLQRQDDEIASLKKMVLVQHGRGSPIDSPRHPSSSSNNVSSQTPSRATRPIRVGNMVSLKSLFDPTKIVAKGYLRSLNPLDEVGGQALGPNWCEIQIQVAMSPHEQLIRPYDLQQTIQDALGAPVAWPCHLVETAEE
ncbi:uncharacterized protein LOC113768932 [Coffea eugenioides]|uniref:uncharacterized protein LOC113759730 n=1 Tax=Coffea eugenioides TaxID=49369 RepID=UPI000F612CF2|nr:uncharacterized protein LOC113759730 [Coffea eugenioides]XP_027168063.1 uncharacterized protein LOC113768035 [Coffea eugenioides]XP_027168292.1 uncharacterized protein LOC113768219 [Coffea eugenioides]XP_027169232.1 uncharacterized protein LOC113768930 [Coffea eugenioides]XP_027169234.1 uncharacterized protein LOC113768932 [Coffea eugenioides]